MPEIGPGVFESVKQGQLPWGRVHKVSTAHNIGYSHQRIIHHACQLVGKKTVFAPDHKITHFGGKVLALLS